MAASTLANVHVMTQQNLKSLYRQLLRESDKLPYGYLRAFFRFKFRDDTEAAVRSFIYGKRSYPAQEQRLKKNAQVLARANSGDKPCLRRILDQAYGRVGKLKHELMEPFILASKEERGPPIIAGKEKSRPPAYPPYLKALLTTSLSRSTGKPIKNDSLRLPPSLPDRIDPESKAVRLLGRVSKRREVNARWRLFTEETQRILPPLQISRTLVASHLKPEENAPAKGTSVEGGFQRSGVLDMLIRIAGQPEDPPEPRRGFRRRSQQDIRHSNSDTASKIDESLPSRSLRRIHKELLGRIPVLTLYTKPGGKEIFEVHPPTGARSSALRFSVANLPEIDEANLAWILKSRE